MKTIEKNWKLEAGSGPARRIWKIKIKVASNGIFHCVLPLDLQKIPYMGTSEAWMTGEAGGRSAVSRTLEGLKKFTKLLAELYIKAEHSAVRVIICAIRPLYVVAGTYCRYEFGEGDKREFHYVRDRCDPLSMRVREIDLDRLGDYCVIPFTDEAVDMIRGMPRRIQEFTKEFRANLKEEIGALPIVTGES